MNSSINKLSVHSLINWITPKKQHNFIFSVSYQTKYLNTVLDRFFPTPGLSCNLQTPRLKVCDSCGSTTGHLTTKTSEK